MEVVEKFTAATVKVLSYRPSSPWLTNATVVPGGLLDNSGARFHCSPAHTCTETPSVTKMLHRNECRRRPAISWVVS
jgi:hypothetical protein